MCGHVVQFTRDPRPLLHDRLTRGDVTLALGVYASIAVARGKPAPVSAVAVAQSA